MYLFHRSARLGPGSAHEQMSWSLSMTEKVNQISETPVSLWTPFLSPGVNTLIWTTMVDSLSTLEAANDKLLVDEGYHMLLEQGARYASTDAINDGLVQFLQLEATNVTNPPAYVSVVQAQLAPGSYVHGIEVGLEIAQRAKAASGVDVSFAIATTGIYGQVEWHAGYDSVEHLQRANEALNADISFAQYLDSEVKQVYQPTGATQKVFRRLA